ncbi:MAG: site-2 protease family protein [Planctomycetes bacterium]|nr:site-2 protease family protein [Planctomycetota bacterium]
MASSLTVRVGSIARIPVRLHLLLPGLLLLQVLTTPGYATAEVLVPYLVFWGVMTVSILLHELGHAFAARRHGLGVHGIVLWPLGGYTTCDRSRRPRARMAVASGGVVVNLALALAAGAGMLLRGRDLPGIPDLVPETDLLRATWNLNLALLVLNLLPGVPYDGGSMLEVLLWKRLGVPRARLLVTGTGAVIGVGLVLGGLSHGDMMLVVLGGWGLWKVGEAWREVKETGLEDEQLLFGAYDFSNGYRSLDQSGPEPDEAERRRERDRRREADRARAEAERREAAALRARADAARRLDGLLDRIAAEGITSLSAEEKAFLNEESRRLRAKAKS